MTSADPDVHPDIRMNYFDDPHDMGVMIAALRRALDVVAHWPAHREIGPLLVPPALAAKHGYAPATRRATTSSRTSRATTPGPCTT